MAEKSVKYLFHWNIKSVKKMVRPMLKKEVFKVISNLVEKNSALIDEVNDNLWEFAEPAMQEKKSSSYLKHILERLGFTLTPGVPDMPTSFVAYWGDGAPHIGFLAEYDALKGLSQDKVPICRPVQKGAPGHGCGHCTLSAAILGAVVALKTYMEKEQLKGTIFFFGCPAEETLEGKVRMSRNHLFETCDIALSCHPNDVTYVWDRKSVSLLSLKYSFLGISAHAGLDPWNGRSALDAVELMNIGANYLREHIPPTWKLHYTTLYGGDSPNIVPKQAEVWYMLRADDREQVENLHQRLSNIAHGAAIMTDTHEKELFVAGCYNFLPNHALAKLLLECAMYVGAPKWTKEDYTFAKQLYSQIPDSCKKASMQQFSLKKEDIVNGLSVRIYKKCFQNGIMGAATDVGDVSWQLPVGCVSFASTVVGAPGHSWFYTATCGSGIGHRGAHAGAKILAIAGYRLMTEPILIKAAKKEFLDVLAGRHYNCPIT
jgi:aminobenzoyl-glutamate utilization protein B